MSDPSPGPRRRRERTAFHYKVDETLRPEHREPYLALLRDPCTRIDDAHAWLMSRGYVLSRSAVARHRRRLLARDADHADGLRQAEMFARLAARPGGPDFAAAAEIQLQHLVFRHVLALGDRHAAARNDAADRDDEGAAAAAAAVYRRLDPEELLRVSKLITALAELAKLRSARNKEPRLAGQATAGPPSPPLTDEELAQRINAILSGKQ